MDAIQEGTASKSAGSIHFTTGKVEAISSDGTRRVLQAGDVIYPNETVLTGADGVIHIDLVDGQVLELGNNDEFSFASFYQDFMPEDAEVEIEAEQVEVLPVPDNLPPPAAGQPDGQGNSGFGSQTILDLSGIQVDPEAGFDTSGLLTGIEDSTSFVADELLGIDENDQSIILVDQAKGDSDQGSITEDQDTNKDIEGIQLQQSGTLTVIDPDIFDRPAFDPAKTVYLSDSSTNSTALGQLIITADGQWNYEVANGVVQYLDDGEKVTEVFQVETTDGTTKQITITINGAEDPSNILVDGSNGDSDAGAVTEDKAEDLNDSGQLVTGGTLTVTDADGDGAFSPTVTLSSVTDETGQTTNDGSQTGLGSLVINAQGGWEFKVDNAAVQYLDAGEKITQVYTVSTADGNDTETITITINGAEDPSNILVDGSNGDSDAGAVTEDKAEDLNDSGQLV
ncbi:retention module-containing protein, partial [Endozoicomonas atrinae]|uniref:retention module-containing protein n=1 Tax=Endozoicomonas atrinae TaxID=1333660 RepID=UPI001585F130